MIHRIYSSLPTFKDLSLNPGLNVLIAEKSEGATREQSRNAAGKSSVLEIIHYLALAFYFQVVLQLASYLKYSWKELQKSMNELKV